MSDSLFLSEDKKEIQPLSRAGEALEEGEIKMDTLKEKSEDIVENARRAQREDLERGNKGDDGGGGNNDPLLLQEVIVNEGRSPVTLEAEKRSAAGEEWEEEMGGKRRFQREPSVRGNEADSDLFVEITEGSQLPSSTEAAEERLESLKDEVEDKMEVARRFQLRQLAGKDDDYGMFDKSVLSKRTKTHFTTGKGAEPTSTHQDDRHPIARRTSSSSSSSSLEFIESREVKKPTPDKPFHRTERPQQPKPPSNVNDKTKSSQHTAKESHTVLVSKSSRPNTNTTTPNPTDNNHNTNVDNKNHLTTPNPAITSKPKPLHWKDVKEKSPSARYGHDIHRPLGPDNGSMDAFIVTESRDDPRPGARSGPADSMPKVRVRREEAERERVQQRQRIWREEQERRDWQRGHAESFQDSQQEHQQRQQGQKRTVAPTAHMFDADSMSHRSGGSGGGGGSDLGIRDRARHVDDRGGKKAVGENEEKRKVDTAPAAPAPQAAITTPARSSVGQPGANTREKYQQRHQNPDQNAYTSSSAIPSYKPRESDISVALARDFAGLDRGRERVKDVAKETRLNSRVGDKGGERRAIPARDKVKGTVPAGRTHSPSASMSSSGISHSPATTDTTTTTCSSSSLSSSSVSSSSSSSNPPRRPQNPGIRRIANKSANPVLLNRKAAPSSARAHHSAIFGGGRGGGGGEGGDGKRPPAPTAVLKGNLKRAIGDVPVGTLFEPKQIMSKWEYERRKRRRVAWVEEGEVAGVEGVQAASDNGEQSGRVCGEVSVMPTGITSFERKKEVVEAVRKGVNGQKGGNPTKQVEGSNHRDKRRENSTTTTKPAVPSNPSTRDEPVSHLKFPSCAYGPSPTLTPPLPARPTTSRKTVSATTLAALYSATNSTPHPIHPSSSASNVEPTASYRLSRNSIADEQQAETLSSDGSLTTPPEILYHYTVTRSDFGPGIASKGESVDTDIGAFYTLNEANEQAMREARRERTVRPKRKRSRKGWTEEEMLERAGEGLGSEIGVNTDEVGCQTWRVVKGGGDGVVVAVTRDVAPRTERMPFLPRDAFWVPRKVFVVLQHCRPGIAAGAEDDGGGGDGGVVAEGEGGGIQTLKACTTLDLANVVAGNAFLGFQTRHLGKSGADIVERSDCQREMRKHLAALERVDEPFDERVGMVDGGWVKVWVEEVPVTGPRN